MSPTFSHIRHTYNEFMESSLIKRLFIYMANEKVLQNCNYIPDVEEKHSLEAEVTSHSHHKTQES